MKPEHRRYLVDGDIPGCRSERTFAVACRMLEVRYQPEEIFTVLISASGSWEAALDKRGQDVARARALVWADIGRAQKVLRSQDMSLQERADEWSALGLRTVVKQKAVQVERSSINAVRILTDHSEWRGRLALDITTGRIVLDGMPLYDHSFFTLQERVSAYAGGEPGSSGSGGRTWCAPRRTGTRRTRARWSSVAQKLGSAFFAQAGLDSPVPSGAFFDLFPVSVITTSSLARFAELQPASRFDARRFRKNVVLGTGATGFPENDWIGSQLALGDGVRLRLAMPDPRCV